MRESAKEFFSRLHQIHLKPRGYKKVRQTFSRSIGGYTERVQFQGSAFNDASHPCRFYINFGVAFHSIRARVPCRDFPETHCWTRIEEMVRRAPSQYDLPDGNVEEFAVSVAKLVFSASEAAEQQIQVIRQAYCETKSSRLTLHK